MPVCLASLSRFACIGTLQGTLWLIFNASVWAEIISASDLLQPRCEVKESFHSAPLCVLSWSVFPLVTFGIFFYFTILITRFCVKDNELAMLSVYLSTKTCVRWNKISNHPLHTCSHLISYYLISHRSHSHFTHTRHANTQLCRNDNMKVFKN